MSYIGGQDESGPEFTIESQEFADRTARREGNWGWGWGVGARVGDGGMGGGGWFKSQVRFERSLIFRRFKYKCCLGMFLSSPA
jgi:hypothetical protein